jgi:exosortase A-associated hydrolase 2
MEALFIDGPAGRLFCVYHAAEPLCRQSLGLVYLPPFAEEMNRSRRMAALQARRLAALGIDVLLLDPFGTGDSAGDFHDARWEIWREDTKAAVEWLGARCDGRVGLWGLRLGAMLAAEVAADIPVRPARLLLWQPVLSGERHLVQFLRLRVAAGMGKAGKEKDSARETAGDLRSRLSRGEQVEVAGYELAPALAGAIAARTLSSLLEHLPEPEVAVLEVGASGDPGAATARMLEALEHRNLPCLQAVRGQPFWTLQEITLAPELIKATAALFRS